MAANIANKEITIAGEFKATIPVWASLGTTFLSTVFYIVAYAAIGWGYVEIDGPDGKITHQFGLWQTCHNMYGCRYWASAELSAAFRATQAFATIALLLMLFGVLLTIAYIFFLRVQRVKSICLMLAGCHGVTFLLLMITLSIFGARWRDDWQGNGYRTIISYSMALTITSLFLELISAGLVAFEAMLLMRATQAGKAQQRQGAPAQQAGQAAVDMTPPAANYAEPAGPSAGPV